MSRTAGIGFPPSDQTLRQAVALHRQGRLAEAERLYRAALAAQPRQFEVLHFLGLLKLQQGHAGEAIELLRAAAEAKPDAAEVHPSLGAALVALGRHEEALAVYDGILRAKPDDVDAGYNRGVVLSHLGRHAEALASYDKVLASQPEHVPALFNRGNVLAMFERFEEALASYDRAVAPAPNHLGALANRANALKALKRYDEAIAAYDRVLRIVPENADALNNRGNTFFELRRYESAVASFRAALSINSEDPEVLFNLGRALQEIDHDDEALAAFDRLLAIRPKHADACYSRGNSLLKLNRPLEAATAYQNALSIDPAHPHAFSGQIRAQYSICNWKEVARLTLELETHLENGTSVIEPLQLMCLPTSPAQQLACARAYVRRRTASLPQPMRPRIAHARPRIRVAYVSADFCRHVVGTVVAELLELHDRNRFEVLGFSLGIDDGSEIRSRISRSFDRFCDVRSRSDGEIVSLMQECEVDIAVDLMGHTRQARTEILAYRPAPIQVNYLGYPGTTGADFIDYIIADPVVLPLEQQPFFSEKIVHLPDSYLANDSRQRKISDRIPTRRELELPESGFVFCAFTQNNKITAAIFDVWMRLLRAVQGSALWLARTNEPAMANLRREAQARDIDPARLVFAPRVDPLADHLARQYRADLYLDTLPYNAHTTTANALWAGLPVLTCKGNTFAGRVGASLLYAAGLPELVTYSLHEYQALALKLATEPSLLQSIRRKLAENRPACPLFDNDRFRRHIEAAYLKIWDIYQRGEPPRHIRIEPASADRE